ncbi:GGDEF domain-containing protein [Hyphomonas pacifica]|uniref:diguanylate cyclase n=1 Tax=Hyphomonas pacifica TaxID=1280941 RepID=A0A062TUW2_9PROT|nr:GGDEF domain-containing protein [Hyphomonas pacifica]KCZ51791.1 hypothetical protein HY2_10900 [Hyphomonas pacifica]RAN30576.1 hypothetical protein HY3_05360 [Hyphomonas pacifica]RAN38064.1 hypothetical protein HY11_07305 [Hyphomonas pacifica]
MAQSQARQKSDAPSSAENASDEADSNTDIIHQEGPSSSNFDNIIALLRSMLMVETVTVSIAYGQHEHLLASSALPQDDIYSNVQFFAGVPIYSYDKEIIGTLSIMDSQPRKLTPNQLTSLEDVARVASDLFELRKLASIDGLTGQMTRRAFEQESRRVLQLSSRHRHNVSIIGLDVDHFKSINDTYGHAAGDEVLKKVAQSCAETLRTSDMLGRLGGEEFAVLLQETDHEGATQVAEKLRMAISLLRFEFDGKTVGVTASFGITSNVHGDYDLSTLMEQADAAMYKAKQTGRNRCVAYGDEQLPERVLRRRVLKSGQIQFAGNAANIDCTVRQLGQDGAGLDLVTTTNVPNEFRLHIRSDGLTANCRVVSRTQTHLDVVFR